MSRPFRECKQETLSALRQVAEMADRSGATSLAARLRHDRIPRLEGERLHLVLLGEFNHGKTTFLNRLLGEELLPTGVTPTTAVIHHVVHGPSVAVAAVKEDGKRVGVERGDLAEWAVEGRAKAEGVHHLELTHPSPLLEGGVVLVDTPGVNDLNEARAEITYGYVPQADAVLFLLDAGQILKESERVFVAGKLLAPSRDKVLFIINKMDVLSAGERDEVVQYARDQLGQILDAPRVYPLSAKTGDGVEELREELTRLLTEERGRVLLDNALGEGIRTARTLEGSLEVQRHAFAMEQADLERRLAALESDLETSADKLAERKDQVREALASVKALAREDAVRFGKRFGEALPGEIEGSQTRDLRQYLAGFIEERMREFAEQEAEVIGKKLERVAEEAIAFVAEDARAQAERMRAVLGEGAPHLELDVDTFAYDVGVFALGAFGVTLMAFSNLLVGGAMALAAPVVAWLVRGRVDREVKARAAEDAPRLVRQAADRMADAFDERIDAFGRRLIEFLDRANAELTRSVAGALRAVRKAHAEGAEATAHLEQETKQTLIRLRDVTAHMLKLRKAI